MRLVSKHDPVWGMILVTVLGPNDAAEDAEDVLPTSTQGAAVVPEPAAEPAPSPTAPPLSPAARRALRRAEKAKRTVSDLSEAERAALVAFVDSRTIDDAYAMARIAERGLVKDGNVTSLGFLVHQIVKREAPWRGIVAATNNVESPEAVAS